MAFSNLRYILHIEVATVEHCIQSVALKALQYLIPMQYYYPAVWPPKAERGQKLKIHKRVESPADGIEAVIQGLIVAQIQQLMQIDREESPQPRQYAFPTWVKWRAAFHDPVVTVCATIAFQALLNWGANRYEL